jgi:hypothetical protein
LNNDILRALHLSRFGADATVDEVQQAYRNLALVSRASSHPYVELCSRLGLSG